MSVEAASNGEPLTTTLQSPQKEKASGLAKYLLGLFLTTLADRLAQIQLLSFIVLSGPDGEGRCPSPVFLLLPLVLFSVLSGLEGDKNRRKETLVISSAGRCLIMLIAPVIFIKTGALGLVIPSVLFSICTLVALFLPNALALLPDIGSTHLNALSACAHVAITNCATLTALSLFQQLSSSIPGISVLSVCAAPYLVAAILFWFIPENPVAMATLAGKQDSFGQYLKDHKKCRSLLSLSVAMSLIGEAFITVFTVLVLQGIDFSGISTFDLFQSIAGGMVLGPLLLLLLQRLAPIRLRHALVMSTALMALLCLVMAAVADLRIMRPLYVVLGILSSICATTAYCLIMQVIPRKLLGKAFGLTLTIRTVLLLPAILVVDQVALHFSAFTLLRTINCASTVLIVVVLVSSHMLRASLNQIINNKMRLTGWSGGIRR